jgi:hypothetical protein
VIDLNALGAFLSGGGAVLSAWWAIHRIRQADDAECEKRLAAFREGLRLGKEKK